MADGWIFTSGQIPVNPESQTVVEGGIFEQTHRVLRNLSAVLEAAGGSLESVVKTTVYLSDMGNFPAVNEVYGEYFESHWPARATIQAAGLPKGVAVEIDAVARVLPTDELAGREPSPPLR